MPVTMPRRGSITDLVLFTKPSMRASRKSSSIDALGGQEISNLQKSGDQFS